MALSLARFRVPGRLGRALKLARQARLWTALGLLAVAPSLRAQLINLGDAANFAGLELGSSVFTISKNTTIVNGNVGVDSNQDLSFSGGGTINGSIYGGDGTSFAISGSPSISGGTFTNSSLVLQAVADATSAASYYAGLAANESVSASIFSNGGTITGSGGLNVIDVTGGINLSRSTLTLSGTASDTFVINVTGGIDLSRSNIVLSGINPDQVLFNLAGTGTELTTTGDSDTAGIFLAANGGINLSGGTHDADFISGGSMIWQSGVTVTQATSLISPVPEMGRSAMAAAGGGFLLIFGLSLRLRRRTLAA